MASGSFYKSITGYDYRLIVEWSSTSSVENNTSVVTATAKLYCPYALYIDGRSGSVITINGVNYTFNSPAISTSGGTTHILGTVKSNAISHNADGTKSVSISCTWGLNATISGTYYGTQVASGTATLDNIARKVNLVSAPNFNDEQNPTITYENPTGSLVTKAEVCLSWDNTEVTIPYREIDLSETSYTFNLTDAERKTLRQGVTGSSSRKIYFSIRSTMNGKYYYSSLVKTFTIYNGYPVMVPTVVDVNPVTLALTDNRDTIIRHYSTAQYAFNATARKEATIASYRLVNGSVVAVTATGTIPNVASGTFTFTVKDSRNSSFVHTIEKEFVDYVPPTCVLEATAPDAEGNVTFTFDGTFFNGSFGAQDNVLDARYRYKTGNGEYGEWIPATRVSTNGNAYTATVEATGLDYTQAITFQAKVSDSLESATSEEQTVRTIPIFDWGENDFNFNVPVNCGGDLEVQGNTVMNGNLEVEGDTVLNGTLEIEGKLNLPGGWFTNSNVLLEFPNGSYMMDDQDYTLPQKISEQPNGIVLVFSGYDAATATVKNTSWNTFFVSKYSVYKHGGQGHCFLMVNNSDFLRMGAKYIWIADNSIAGSVSNTLTGTGGSGIRYENNAFVLRYVLGV